MIVLCGNLTIPYCGRFFHCFYLEERKNCATALAGHRAAILFNRDLEVAMKNYTQVYVKNSFEAAETYCKAFGAEITREFKNEDNTIYEHCELSVNGEGFLALAEAKNPCDINMVHKHKWETMTFNVFEMGTEDAVYNAFQVLSDGGVIIEPIGELPWSKCCATIIDKYGVCWWISI